MFPYHVLLFLLTGEESLKENCASEQVGAPTAQKVVKIVYHIVSYKRLQEEFVFVNWD